MQLTGVTTLRGERAGDFARVREKGGRPLVHTGLFADIASTQGRYHRLSGAGCLPGKPGDVAIGSEDQMKLRNGVDGSTARAIILSNVGSRGGLDILRALAYERIGAILASPDSSDLTASSRYCAGRVLLKPYAPEWDDHNVRALAACVNDSPDRPVLFYSEDAEMMFVSRNRGRLADRFRFLVPRHGLSEELVDKVRFQRLAERHRLPVPATTLVHSQDELACRSPEMTFPVFIKPATPSSWTFETPALKKRYRSYKHALRQFATADEMLEYCKDLPIERGGVLVQEFIGGSDREVYSFHGYFDESSNPLAYFVGRKIRTYPIHHGGSAYIESVEEPTVTRTCIEALQSIGFQGVCKVDLKRNPTTGSFRILEINPRYTLWVSLGAFAGVNLPIVAFHHQRGEAVESPTRKYHAGYRWLFLKQDLRAFVSDYWRKGEWTVPQYLLSLRGKKVYQFFDWHDPMPFFRSGVRFWKRLALRLLRAVTRGPMNRLRMTTPA